MPKNMAGKKNVAEKITSNDQCKSFCHAKRDGRLAEQPNTTNYIEPHDIHMDQENPENMK